MAISHVECAASPGECSDDPIDAAFAAYTFAYPLLVMDATRRVATSVARADCELGTGAPINQFSHLRRLLGIELDGVSRPNLDILYSFLWFDVSEEPLIIGVPDAEGRFYSLSLLDHWSDVFASPGARTAGTGAQTFAITGPSWVGALPRGVRECASPTARGWLLGLMQVRGVADIPEVARFQAGMSALPWSAWRSGRALGGASTTSVGHADVLEDPVTFVTRMTPSEYFGRFCELLRDNPPHERDEMAVALLRRMGIVPGERFAAQAVPRAVRSVLEVVKGLMPARLEAAHQDGFRVCNHWRTPRTARGEHGTDYLLRASMAHAGLGAQASEDAVDFAVAADAQGAPLSSSTPYTLTFRPGQLPPAQAFWSLTLYDEQHRLAPNAIGRFSLGSGDDLIVEPDGSLIVHMQRDCPGDERERNWLPAPVAGSFRLSLRLYWPKRSVLDGAWDPPPLRRSVSMPAPGKLWFARDRFEWSEDA